MKFLNFTKAGFELRACFNGSTVPTSGGAGASKLRVTGRLPSWARACAAVSLCVGLLNPVILATPSTPAPAESEEFAEKSNSKLKPNSKDSALVDPPVASPAHELPGVFSKSTPQTIAELAAIEQHLTNILAKVSGTVVAVEVRGSTGSGVVISSDGLVMTAAHVCDTPDLPVRIIFPDGKRARGRTMGTNHEGDAGLLRITDAGPWTYSEVAGSEQPDLGDWVLALGHPGGYDEDRPVVVRLGRVIRVAADAVQTDCTITAGDSGGPLFDMSGRVIGIHSRISTSAADNYHVSIGTFRETWDRLARGENWGQEEPPPRPWVGARGMDHPDGCRLERIDENSPAARAGLKIGDIIRKVNEQVVKDYAGFRRILEETAPGKELNLELQREAEQISVTVKVEARPRFRR